MSNWIPQSINQREQRMFENERQTDSNWDRMKMYYIMKALNSKEHKWCLSKKNFIMIFCIAIKLSTKTEDKNTSLCQQQTTGGKTVSYLPHDIYLNRNKQEL